MTHDIYVVEHPRSGATWLQRLLSDILQAPLHTAVGLDGTFETQYWGEGQPDIRYAPEMPLLQEPQHALDPRRLV